MSNFLLTPSNFKDDNNTVPASYWSNNKFVFVSSGSGINKLTSVVSPVGGDVISFDVILNSATAATLTVNISGSVVYEQALVQNVAYNFTSTALTSTDIVIITLSYATTATGLNVWLTPATTSVNASGIYSLKSFMSFGSLVNNASSEVSIIGELSDRSLTFSEDQATYSIGSTGTTSTSITLTAFSSKDGNGNAVTVPSDYVNDLLTIGRWIYSQATANLFTSDSSVFTQALLAEFSSIIGSLTTGEMVGLNNVYMPEYIIFKFNNAAQNVNYTPDNRIKIWFSDAAFQSQYDEYVIKFVTPIPTLDNFFLTSTTVQSKVNEVTMVNLVGQIQSYGQQSPYTVVETISFNYYDPLDSNITIPTNWTFVIYGAAGNNIDIQKELLSNYILANSSHSREEWVTIFPDIFTSTEFILTPLWNQYAIPNLTLEQGVYSPTVSITTATSTALATAAGVGYNETFVNNVLSIVPTTYKSSVMLAVGGSENKNGLNKFYSVWPDYIAVSTSSLDFNRMQPNTQNFINLLYQMFTVAETMTDVSDIPQGMSRLTRANGNGQVVSYLVSSLNNVEYLMVTRESLISLVGIINPS